MPSLANEQSAGPLNVLVVGGGIAGVMLAILLERKGHAVTIIEQSKEWRPVGGGITLTLNGVKILKDLGLLNEIRSKANEIRNINIADQQGKILSSFNLDEYSASYAPTFTILRSDLHQILIGQLQRCRIHLNTVFTSIKNEGDTVKVVWSDGVTRHYDLVAGCDGINSAVRKHLFTDAANEYSGYASWRFLAHGVVAGDGHTITEMWGNGKRFGIVPLTGDTVHCFASVNTLKNNKPYSNIGLPEFKELFESFGSVVSQLIGAVKTSADLMYNDLEDVSAAAWHKGRVVLVGDAAHGMTPNMTQGASMAIEDACVLAGRLYGRDTIEEDIAAYYNARKVRVCAIQKKSQLLGKIGQISNPVLCGLRNFFWENVPDKWIQNDLKNLLVSDVPYL